MNNPRKDFSRSGDRHHHALTEIEGMVRRTSSLIALTCITARLLVYPLDAISWHVFGRNFNLPRTYQHALDTLLLVSVSAAAVLGLASLSENTRARQWAGSRISDWEKQCIRAARLLLAMLAAAALILLCWWIWGEAIKDWLLPIQIHHS